MGWLRRILTDPTCGRCTRLRAACICNRPGAAAQRRALTHRLPAGSDAGRNQVAGRRRTRRAG